MYKRMAQAVVSMALLMSVMAGAAQASVQVIGTADIGGVGTGYNLIYDTGSVADGLPSFVWLDYTNTPGDWSTQLSWAAGLNALGAVTYHLNPGINIDWGVNSWRLPSTVDGPVVYRGYDGTTIAGYNITSSELGHLYYTELGNKGAVDTSGNALSGVGLVKTGSFNNLKGNYWYCSGTGYLTTGNNWAFQPTNGEQMYFTPSFSWNAIAVRSGQFSVVPEPSTYLLLGISLGVVGYVRRRMSAR